MDGKSRTSSHGDWSDFRDVAASPEITGASKAEHTAPSNA
jgi:hypothetical protein